ncbi:hypothetical protein C8Q75DRAFT_772965 [Abortiporus biennis]|nr:hypothetical protein C8Q75DRAFT_772965 [Abortiporus biennis]
MPRVVELARFGTSEAYQKDTSIIKPALEFLSKVKGCNEIFHGLKAEDPNIMFLIIVWDSVEIHHVFMNNKELAGKVGQLLASSITEFKPPLLHAAFSPDSLSPFRAPITEFAYSSVKPELIGNVDIKEVESRLQVVVDKRLADNQSAALGRTLEDDSLTVGILGWDSVQAHIEWATKDPIGSDVVGKFGEVSKIVCEHVALKEFS